MSDDSSDEKMRAALQSFYDKSKEIGTNLAKERFILREDYILPKKTRYSNSWVFIQLVDSASSRLSGELNRFLLGIVHADSWCQVAQKLDKCERLGLLWEFGEPHLELSVCRPYSIKNQFIFSAVHILHQSKRLKDRNWVDHLSPDRDINYGTLLKFVGDWKAFPPFLEALGRLNGQDFREKTLNLRHHIQHRFRTHVGYGITPLVERIEADTGVTYNFKLIPSLDLSELITAVYKQHSIALEVFQRLWELALEMCVEWDLKCPYPEPRSI